MMRNMAMAATMGWLGIWLPLSLPWCWGFSDYSPAPWKVGERLVYAVEWCGFNVGQAIVEVASRLRYSGHECFLLRAETRGNRFVNSIYPVEDRIESYVDVRSLQPRKFVKSLREGRYRKDEYIDFDWGVRRATYYRRDWKVPGEIYKKKLEIEFPLNVHDPLSSIFYLRALKPRLGQTISMIVNTDKNNWEIKAALLRRETLKLPGAGRFEALYLEPEYKFEGLFRRRNPEKGGDVRVWLDSRTLLPLQMTVDVFIGKIKVYLEERST